MLCVQGAWQKMVRESILYLVKSGHGAISQDAGSLKLLGQGAGCLRFELHMDKAT